jgi:MscS family membrane protein
MEKLLQQKIFDNTIQSYLLVIAIILLAVFLKRIGSKFIARILHGLFIRKSKRVGRETFQELVVQPLDTFLVLLVTIITLDSLVFPTALNINVYHISLKQMIDSVVAATVVIVFIWLCLRMVDFIALVMEEKADQTADQADNQLVVFFKDFFKVILVMIGILLVFKFSFNKPIGNLLTGLSIVGAAIALATRESIENLIASFIIFFDRPFVTGDQVKVNNFTGIVEKIGLRSTRIRTLDKTYISVPNKQMVDTIIDNITLRTQRKVELRLELDLNATATQISTLVAAIKKILEQPAIENQSVFFMDTGKQAHIIAVDYFTSILQTIEEFNTLRESVNLEVITLLKNSDVMLAAVNTEIVLNTKSASA